MELRFDRQITEAAAALLAGLGLGLLYELVSALRRRSAPFMGALLDVLYCAVFAFALFLIGMGPGRGTLRLYMPPLALLGAAAWDALFGAAVRRRIAAVLRFADRIRAAIRRKLEIVRKLAKKIEKFFKNIFSIVKKWFTIINNHATDRVRKRNRRSEVTADEAEAFQFVYEDRDPGADRLRVHFAGRREKPHRRGAGRSGRAAGQGGRRPAGKRGAGV